MPYLFIWMADVLQLLIKNYDQIRHPLVDAVVPMLQYTDDTIILL